MLSFQPRQSLPPARIKMQALTLRKMGAVVLAKGFLEEASQADGSPDDQPCQSSEIDKSIK
jgi:hypothetical protein